MADAWRDRKNKKKNQLLPGIEIRCAGTSIKWNTSVELGNVLIKTSTIEIWDVAVFSP